jgi:hypothetical protein
LKKIENSFSPNWLRTHSWKVVGRLDRAELGPAERGHALGGRPDAQVRQRLEGLQRIGVELLAIIDPRQARAVDEVVGQDLVPEVDDLLALREEPVAADVELEALVVHGPADAADIGRVHLQHGHATPGLGQGVGGRQAGRAGADHQGFHVLGHAPFSNPVSIQDGAAWLRPGREAW